MKVRLSIWRPAAAVIPILTILAMMTTPAALAQVRYGVTDLGTLGGSFSEATCINNSGQIAGDSYTSNGVTHAFLYSGGNMTDLDLPGGTDSVAYGINNNGQVVGFCVDSNQTQYAFLCTAGMMTNLDTRGRCPGSIAYGINDSGRVVGWCFSGSAVGDVGSAVQWSGDGMGNLGILGGGYDWSCAQAINSNGQIVGTAYKYPDPYNVYPRAFLFSGGTMINLLGTLGGVSCAVAINNNGQIVGNSAASGAFLWSTNIVTELGTLGGNASSASGINNNGQIVGGSNISTSNHVSHAFLYSGGKMTDLNSLLVSNPGWTLVNAEAINDRGQIVGQGINPSGLTHAFLLTPNPHRATATAAVLNGSVVGATITDSGWGYYSSPPTVLIQGGGGTGATATAVVSNGVVVGITITDAGTGYTNPPSIYIYSPFGLQVGLIKAVTPSFSDLIPGTNYQLQVSGDLNNWTNQGSVFTATNPTSIYPQYWNVDNWSQLFFRLQVAP